jgi:hypothetical protein
VAFCTVLCMSIEIWYGARPISPWALAFIIT